MLSMKFNIIYIMRTLARARRQRAAPASLDPMAPNVLFLQPPNGVITMCCNRAVHQLDSSSVVLSLCGRGEPYATPRV